MENLLEIKNLCKEYKDFSLKNVSFTVPKGSIMGFIGENGAGKTTTLKLILDEVKRSAGEILVFGMDNLNEQKKIKQEIGVVFDEPFFYMTMKPGEVGRVLSAAYDNWDDALYVSYLMRFRLPREKSIKEYSRGMKMKLSIAAALAHRPKLLLLDEATSGLDPVVRREILDVFLGFIQNEEHGILLSSHITSDLEQIADYITFIHEGGVVFSESKDVILERYGVAHCTADQLRRIGSEHLVGSRKTQFCCDALVSDRERVAAGIPGLSVDPASLDDIMSYYAGGVEQ